MSPSVGESLVSVVVPVHNGASFLEASLDSIAAQSHRPLEVIVVDDGSDDETPAVAQLADVRLIRQERSGPSAARNRGAAAASGDHIAFHDADDLMLPHRIGSQARYLGDHPDIECALGCWTLFTEDAGGGTTSPAPFPALHPPSEPLSVRSADAVRYLRAGGMTALISREALEVVGGFDPSLSGAEDVEWLFRLRDSGVQAAILPSVVMLKRIHAHNLSRDRRSMQTGWVGFLKGVADRRHPRGAQK